MLPVRAPPGKRREGRPSMDGRRLPTSRSPEGVLHHIVAARRDLRELGEDLAALERAMGAGPAGWPRLPRSLPRKVEVAGEGLADLARDLRGLPLLAADGAPEAP